MYATFSTNQGAKPGQPPALVIPTRPLTMLTSRTSRLFRFLLPLVIRLRLSAGRIPVALRSWSTSLWSSILTYARRGGQSWIRPHANDLPVVDNNPMGEGSHISERATKVEEERSETLAALPVWRCTARWQDEVSRYQELTSSRQLEFDALPATPEGGSQRYKPRTVK